MVGMFYGGGVKEMAHVVFSMVEPLGGRQHVIVREYRIAIAWEEEIAYRVDVMCPDVEKIDPCYGQSEYL